MAISAGMVWEVRSGGSDTACSGGFRGGSLLSAPSAPSLSTSGTGGTIAAGTYYFVLTYTDYFGQTVKSAETSITTTGTTSTITVTAPSSPPSTPPYPACFYNIYAGTVSGGPYWQQTLTQSLTSNKTYTSTLASSGTQAPGTDYSQQNALQVNVNNSTITATTAGANSNVLTFSGYTPTAADIGNIFLATGGTNINTGAYEITAFTSTTWTVTGAQNLTTASGAGAAITGVMGGAFATPGRAMQFAIGQNITWIGGGTYSLSSSNNVAAGRITPVGRVIGYDAARADFDGTRPILQSNANSITLCSMSNNDCLVDNIYFKVANSNTSVQGVSMGATRIRLRRCKIDGFQNVGVTFSTGNGNAIVTECEILNCSGATAAVNMGSGYVENCYIHDCSTTGVLINTNTGIVRNTLVVNTSGSGVSAFSITASTGWHGTLENCVVYTVSNGNGFHAPVNAIQNSGVCTNCVCVGAAGASGGTGFDGTWTLNNCAGFNNTLNYSLTNGPVAVFSFQTLTGDPFTNAAGGDYSLNNTTGAGALLRAAGFPSTFPGLSTNNFPDIGAAQGTDTTTAGGGGNILNSTIIQGLGLL
jgi:hypothetical protein